MVKLPLKACRYNVPSLNRQSISDSVERFRCSGVGAWIGELRVGTDGSCLKALVGELSVEPKGSCVKALVNELSVELNASCLKALVGEPSVETEDSCLKELVGDHCVEAEGSCLKSSARCARFSSNETLNANG